MLRCPEYIYIHPACFCTLAASDTFSLFNLYAGQRYLVEKLIYCPKWADPLTERPVEQDAEYYDRDQDNAFKCKKPAKC